VPVERQGGASLSGRAQADVLAWIPTARATAEAEAHVLASALP
jgi:hypothetical protein